MFSKIISCLLKNRKPSYPIPTFNLQLDLTYSCNLSCRHCYQRQNEKHASELSLEDWKKVLQQYFKLTSQLETNTALTLSGGEPLLCPFLKELIIHVRNSGKSVDLYLLTNGTLMRENLAVFLKTHRVTVQISLDGPTEETHDYFRGKGSFLKTLRGAEILNQHNVPFTFQAVLQKRTSHLIADFFMVAKRCNAISMDFTRLIAVGDNDSHEMLAGLELKKAFVNVLDCSKSNQLHTNTSQPLWCLIDPKLGHPSSAGFLDFTVGPNALIQLTSRIKEPIGNAIEKNGLLKTYYDSQLLKTLRSGKIDGCSKCEFFRSCRGNRNISYLSFGDFLGPDEHCWHWREKVSKQQ